MTRRSVALRLALSVLLSGALSTMTAAQSPAPATPTPSPPPPAPKQDLPVDLARIQEEASRQSAVRIDEQQLRFYVLVLAKAPKFDLKDWVGGYDLMNGPTKGGAAMTHKEFVDMVTPRELKELFGATSGSSFAMFQAAVMNAVGQSLISKAVRDLRQASNEREVQVIRERIDAELAALLGKAH